MGLIRNYWEALEELVRKEGGIKGRNPLLPNFYLFEGAHHYYRDYQNRIIRFPQKRNFGLGLGKNITNLRLFQLPRLDNRGECLTLLIMATIDDNLMGGCRWVVIYLV